MIPEPYITAGLWTLVACVMGWVVVAPCGPFNREDDGE